jgi:hypothetical protein
MFRRIIAVVAVAVVGVSFCIADEIRATISKVDGNKVTFTENKGKGQKGDEQTLPLSENAKILSGKFDKETKKVEAGEPLADGVKNDKFTKIGEKGLRALIITDADKKTITEIRVTEGKGK